MLDRNILKGTPLPDLITHLKHDAVEELLTVVIELLQQQGFSFGDLLNGLAGYAHHHSLEKIEGLLESACDEAYKIQKKRFEEDVTEPQT